jgi:ketosteroid isomerase-like protein
MKTRFTIILTLFVLATSPMTFSAQSNKKPMQTKQTIEEVKKNIADLDTEYQRAVKKNDAATMDHILADDFILVTGRGKVFTKADLLKDARDGNTTYEHQEDTQQTVRVWGDTAVITALLWEKGTNKDGSSFDKKLWFSDIYKKTPDGWKYVFAQASIPLPDSP